jgi:tripartite-type tricarboxylate transporter receptor subunit TctC
VNGRRLSAGVAIALSVAAAASAQTAYPVKPIRIIVGSSAGGGGDTMARLMSQAMTTALNQTVVVDNRPGAGGNIGADLVAKAAPDGYTLLFTFTGHVTNPSLYPRLPFDTARDFAGITMLATNESMLVTHPSFPAKSVAELIAVAKKNPGRHTMGGITSGSQHLGSELFKLRAGVDILYVPYKGNATALTDVMGGQLDMMFNTLAITLPVARAGKVRALAVAGTRRSRLAPELPTVSEAGLPGFSFTGWYGMLVPAKTPRPIVQQLNATMVKIVKSPEVAERLAALGNEPVGSSPEEFDRFIREEIPKWARVIKEANIKLSE